MARKIVITSGKGGVGKTTVTANLGYFLANIGQRVLLVDIDFGLNNLDVVTGVENKIIYDMLDVFEGRCRIRQALIQCNNKSNLYILPSISINSDSQMTGQNIKLIIDKIESLFDYILLDCPAGIDVGFHRAVSCADEGIIIATPFLTSLRDADKVISVLKSYKLNNIYLVVNRARGDLMINEQMMYPEEIEKILKTELIGVLPEEDIIFLSCGKIPYKTESYKAYKMLANFIHKGNKKILDVTSKYSGIIGSLRRYIKHSV